jgi:aarF domain-containing kinase
LTSKNSSRVLIFYVNSGNVLVKTALIPVEPSPWSSWFADTKSKQQQKDGPQQEPQYMKVKRSIVFLDAGIAISLSPNDQRNLIDLFRAVIFNDGSRAGRLMVERAKYERCSEVEGCVDAFSEGIQNIVSDFHDRRKEGLTLGAVRIGVLLSRVLDLCRIHHVEIDPAMACVVISTLVLEGLGRSLSPDLDLLNFAKPFVLGRGKV